jgi:hypothetical protein
MNIFKYLIVVLVAQALLAANAIDENNATGVTYASVASEQKGEGGPATLESFTVTGKYFDKFVKTEDGWKISERIFTVIYRKPS